MGHPWAVVILNIQFGVKRLMIWLQKEDQQSEEEAVSARCSDMCDPSKVCVCVCVHWAGTPVYGE
jgi:hypothetical protein